MVRSNVGLLKDIGVRVVRSKREGEPSGVGVVRSKREGEPSG